jgi:glycosyltransferase involved in cell wall biosynthesis
MKKKISFICPCYNEEGNIKDFYDLVKTQLTPTKYNYEMIFINDGSKDSTLEKLEEIYETDKKHVTVINFIRNFGKEAAIFAGLKEARGDYVCTIDTDLQQDPIYAVEMADILEKNDKIDMVAAKPSGDKDGAVLSFFKKGFYTIINYLADIPFRQGVSDFRLFRKNVKDVILSMKEHNRFSKGIFSWVCPDIECIEYHVEPRHTGSSKWSFIKLLKYAIEGICSFSNAPLLLPIITGCLELIICLLLLIAQVIAVLIGLDINFNLRWLIMLILFLTGFQSINIGIIAQYIAKIHTETINRPVYVVKNVLKGDNDLW